MGGDGFRGCSEGGRGSGDNGLERSYDCRMFCNVLGFV